MYDMQDRKNPRFPLQGIESSTAYKSTTMHPDDFKAQLAWVLAKRMQNR